jgi:cation diffusion facilitator family transporter
LNGLFKRYSNTPKNREKLGALGALVGIVSNLFLFVVKLGVGIVLNSVAIKADSVNNLSDCASSVITLFGFKMAGKPADREHPFGHGRVEYLSGVFVCVLMLVIGFDFLKTSVVKIFNPQPVNFNLFTIIILIFTILVKLWQSFFYRKLSEIIGSKTLEATSQDSVNDVIITSAALVSILISSLTKFNCDGIAGAAVSVFILISGGSLLLETSSRILGEPVSAELADNLKTKIAGYENILGVHDLIIHDYGPNKRMATIHAEVPCDLDIESTHTIIDAIEREIFSEYNISLLIHMDPICPDDERLAKIIDEVSKAAEIFPEDLNVHDFRLVTKEAVKNVVFDLEVPHSISENRLKEIIKALEKATLDIDASYLVSIDIESSYAYKKNTSTQNRVRQ